MEETIGMFPREGSRFRRPWQPQGGALNENDNSPNTASTPEASANGFPERLASIIGSSSVRAFARKTGVSDTFLRQCLAGRTDPTRAKLIAIARAANTSLEWLATGQQSAAPAMHTRLDPARLRSIIEITEAIIDERGHILSPHQKAQLITSLYQHCGDVPSRETVEGALTKLVA